MSETEVRRVAAKLRRNAVGCTGRSVYVEGLDEWISLPAAVISEIGRQGTIAHARYCRGGKPDMLALKSPGWYLQQQIVLQCIAAGEPAPIPSL